MSEEQQEEQQEQQPQAESNMQKLAGEDLNATQTEDENSHLQANAEPEGVDPDEIEFVKPEFLPEKFWDPENGTNVEKLSKAYSELEKKFSRGDHKAPKEYNVDFLGENVPEDDEMLNNYKDMAQRYGMSQEDFQDLALQFVGAVEDEAKSEQEFIEEQKRLLGNNAVELVRSNYDWANSLLSKGVISQAEFDVLDQMGGTADGTRLLRKIRNLSSPKELPIPSFTGESKTKEELAQYVSDPRWRSDPVWRKQKEKEFYDNIA